MRQSRPRFPLVILATLILALVAAAPAAAGGRPFSTTLTGAAEVPAGDPDATGTATVWVNPGTGTVCYEWSVSNAGPIAAAHIHHAVAGVPGPVVVPLPPPAAPSSSASGCTTDVDLSLALDIIQHPWEYYVNTHNAEFSTGVARGQLSREP